MNRNTQTETSFQSFLRPLAQFVVAIVLVAITAVVCLNINLGARKSVASTQMPEGSIEQIEPKLQHQPKLQKEVLILNRELPQVAPIEVSFRPVKPTLEVSAPKLIEEEPLFISDIQGGWSENDYLANLEGKKPTLNVLDFLIRLKAQKQSEGDIRAALKNLYDENPNRDLSSVVSWVQTASKSSRGIEFEIAERFRKNADHTAAFNWYLASSKGLSTPEAFFQLGAARLFGRGTEPNYEQAKEYLFYAMRSNQSDAPYLLGVVYLGGLGTPKNETHAYRLFQTGIKKGSSLGYAETGRMKEIGVGTNLDADRAIEIYREGAAKGDRYCWKRLRTLTGESPPSKSSDLLFKQSSNQESNGWVSTAARNALPSEFFR